MLMKMLDILKVLFLDEVLQIDSKCLERGKFSFFNGWIFWQVVQYCIVNFIYMYIRVVINEFKILFVYFLFISLIIIFLYLIYLKEFVFVCV